MVLFLVSLVFFFSGYFICVCVYVSQWAFNVGATNNVNKNNITDNELCHLPQSSFGPNECVGLSVVLILLLLFYTLS